MNTEYLSHKIEKLESVFLNILYLKPEDRIIAPNMNSLGDLKDAINEIFDENTCINVIYTLNTDKEFFGIRVLPNISPSDALVILSTDDKVKLVKYQIEFDSKLFDIGLDGSELAAVTIHEIASMMDNSELFDIIRAIKDSAEENDIISIRDSVNYAQLIIFALKDTMYKLSSMIFIEDNDTIAANPSIQATELANEVVSAKNKIVSSVAGLGDSFRPATPTILNWMFVMFRSMNINSGIIADVLKDAKSFTASKLEIGEIDKTLQAIDRIDTTISMYEGLDINKFLDKKNMSAVNEISLFKNLKRNGLRGIENELYEFAMKVKNCTTSEDAFMIMRGINSRLGILEDYLINDDKMSEAERNHWEYVAQQYRDLRVKLSEKKFKEKKWNIWIDYDKLDELDPGTTTTLS